MAPCLRYSALIEKWLWWRERSERPLWEPFAPPEASQCPGKAAVSGSCAWCKGNPWLWQLPGMAVMLSTGAVLSSSTAFQPVPGQMLPVQCHCIVVIALCPCTLRRPRRLLPSLQGSLCYWAALGQRGRCCQVTSVFCALSHGAMNIYFSQGQGFGFFSPLFNLKYKLFRYIAQALSHDRRKITVKMQRKERE